MRQTKFLLPYPLKKHEVKDGVYLTLILMSFVSKSSQKAQGNGSIHVHVHVRQYSSSLVQYKTLVMLLPAQGPPENRIRFAQNAKNNFVV